MEDTLLTDTCPAGSVFIPSAANDNETCLLKAPDQWVFVHYPHAHYEAAYFAGGQAPRDCLNAKRGGVVTPNGEVFLA